MTNFTWITPRSAPRGPRQNLAVTMSCLPTKDGRKQVRVSLYGAVLDQLGWVAGDRIQIGFAADYGAIALRKHESGNKLRDVANATTMALVVSVPTDTPVFKSHRMAIESCRVTDDTLLVATPWLAVSIAEPEQELLDAAA